MTRLGVNIDHVATVRNARGGAHPDPVKAALLAKKGGADGITAHLREDRRHIRDEDLFALKEVGLPLNFEMAATGEMVRLARDLKPNACCLVPENRQELTTEGGLDVAGQRESLAAPIARLKDAGIRVSLFIDPDPRQADAAKALSADIVEFHTGRFCEMEGDPRHAELERLRLAVRHAHSLGLECHAGHGLDFQTVIPIVALPEIVEVNIGHFLIGQALYEGLENAVRLMKKVMGDAQAKAA